MKSLKQIRTALVEASHEDTEAHFVAPTEAQSSISADRGSNEQAHEYKCSNCDSTDVAMIGGEMLCNECGQDAEKIDEEGVHKGPNSPVKVGSVVSFPGNHHDFYKITKIKNGIAYGKNIEHDKGDECEVNLATDEYEVEKSIKTIRIPESLNAEKDPVEKWITDYTKSTDPRFKGMDKSSRIKMALSDFGAAQKATGKKPVQESHLDGGHEAEEISMTRNELDEIADMADDLFNVLPNFDECPAWIQHKIAGIHASIHGIYDYYRRKSTERQEAAYACDSGTEPDAIRIAVASPVNPVPTELPVPPAKM